MTFSEPLQQIYDPNKQNANMTFNRDYKKPSEKMHLFGQSK